MKLKNKTIQEKIKKKNSNQKNKNQIGYKY
jgi:hypothetical protein